MGVKTEFLRRALVALELQESVSVESGRAEELGPCPALRGQVDVVVARSFGRPAVTADVRPGSCDRDGWWCRNPPEHARKRRSLAALWLGHAGSGSGQGGDGGGLSLSGAASRAPLPRAIADPHAGETTPLLRFHVKQGTTQPLLSERCGQEA